MTTELPIRQTHGRPCTITEYGPAVIEGVRAGLFDSHAAAYAGISRSTLMKWLQRGRKIEKQQSRANPPELIPVDAEYLHFLHTIKKARAERLVRSKRRIDLAAEGGALIEETVSVSSNGSTTTKRRFAQPVWQADAWLVEREDPENHSSSAKQVRELKNSLEMLLKAVHERGLLSPTSQCSRLPAVGGEADPDAI